MMSIRHHSNAGDGMSFDNAARANTAVSLTESAGAASVGYLKRQA
jgi:hypothetical protein